MPIRSRSGKTTTHETENPPMTVQEAGRLGGARVKQKYGPEFYSRIGQKGGEKVQAEAKQYRKLKELGKV
jgi:general stress protein YciG